MSAVTKMPSSGCAGNVPICVMTNVLPLKWTSKTPCPVSLVMIASPRYGANCDASAFWMLFGNAAA
jgi:hypothetical protein